MTSVWGRHDVFLGSETDLSRIYDVTHLCLLSILLQGVEHIHTTRTAAVIFMTCQLKEDTKRSLAEVARVTGTAEVTIRATYQAIHPVAAALVPSWYAGMEEIKRLSLDL